MRQFWALGIDECASNNLSVIACDLRRNGEIVGCFINKDLASPFSEKALS